MTVPIPSGQLILQRIKAPLAHAAFFSALVNLLMLTGSLYMLQVYDRVLASRSVPTLLVLSILALGAYLLQGFLDAIRTKLISRIGAMIDRILAGHAATALFDFPLRGAAPEQATQPLRDIDAVRSFASGQGPVALMDLPFLPLFVIGCFILHPWLGWLAVAGSLFVVAMTVWLEIRSKKLGRDAQETAASRAVLAEEGTRNAMSIVALGMADVFRSRFETAHGRLVSSSLTLSEISSSIGATAKTSRYVLQSAVLALGAYLVIKGEMSAGAIIAASILTSRALAPIELAVTQWKQFVAARQSFRRLMHTIALGARRERDMELPGPRRTLSVENLDVNVPNVPGRRLIQDVRLRLNAGEVLGLVGRSGSGKSTLAKALVGLMPPARGAIRLDGAFIHQWGPEQLGRCIGFAPQDVELFNGTIAENIARFARQPNSRAVLKAAEAAGAHDIIVGMPDGYETRIGAGGAALSGGQKQRIALARALYGDPFLIVLDEPNANLDADGNKALHAAIAGARSRGAIVIIITQRLTGLDGADFVGVMRDGRLVSFGPRGDMLRGAEETLDGVMNSPNAAAPDLVGAARQRMAI